MTNALAEREPAMPKDQIDLIRRTVAKDATNDELALFLYDCSRRGVHPLDKLLHFTKRGGRYTPVTSIDFMRSQAAVSGEMAGSDDPIFTEADDKLSAATVTVYRLTQGQRFAYTATARWAEYCPDNAPMWKRMPHTMLGKCAEALALRKAFPQQLAGLYTTDEMDQADRAPKGYVVEAPAALNAVKQRVDPSVGDSDARPIGAEVLGAADLALDAKSLPPGAVYITKVEPGTGKIAGFLKHSGQEFAQGASNDGLPMFQTQLKTIAEQCCQDHEPVIVEVVTSTTSGKPYVRTIQRIPKPATDTELDAELVRQERARTAGEMF